MNNKIYLLRDKLERNIIYYFRIYTNYLNNNGVENLNEFS